MKWELYIFAGAVSLMVLTVGLILLAVWHHMKMYQQNKMKGFIGRDVLHKVRKLMVDALMESMELLPEKIIHVKQTIDEEAIR